MAIEHGHLYIVDLLIKNGDFPSSYVGLPEGNDVLNDVLNDV